MEDTRGGHTWHLDEGGQGVVELGEGLHVDGETRAPVLGDGVQRQPGQRVVALQHVSETRHYNYHRAQSFGEKRVLLLKEESSANPAHYLNSSRIGGELLKKQQKYSV